MERASALASDRSARKSSRRSALIAAGSIVVTGVALAVAFFPVLFSLWGERDDEGVFVYALREFLSHHGHLYSTIWSDFYGPFYYLVMSTVFRVIHQQPSLENGRWIVLILTTASAALFGGSVWRITKSLPCTILCEIAAFLILIEIAGNEPMHPGSLGVLLVSVVAFELSSYAATRRTLHLVMIGAATGALLMTKVNTGGVLAVAVVFGFVVGNEKVPRWMQMVVGALAALVPVALISQNISLSWADTFAVVVTASIIGLFAVVFIDQLSLPRWPLVPIAAGAGVVMLCSLAFPVLSGTSLRDEISGVFVRPLTLPTAFNVPAQVHLNWLIIVLTVAGIFAAVAFRSLSPEAIRSQSTWTHVALAGVGLWLLGLGSMVFARGWVVAEWLPAIVLLPALAFCARTPEPNRLALRLVAVLATLQILVVYPVAGSQVGWGTVAMVVPCAIALAAGLDHSRVWRESPALMRVVATATVVPRAVRRGQLLAHHPLEDLPRQSAFRSAGNRPHARRSGRGCDRAGSRRGAPRAMRHLLRRAEPKRLLHLQRAPTRDRDARQRRTGRADGRSTGASSPATGTEAGNRRTGLHPARFVTGHRRCRPDRWPTH